jgi:hypothetical protein
MLFKDSARGVLQMTTPKPREFWLEYDPECDSHYGDAYTEIGYAGRNPLHVIDYKAYRKAIEALKFECGNRCAEQNPCNARDVLKELGEL